MHFCRGHLIVSLLLAASVTAGCEKKAPSPPPSNAKPTEANTPPPPSKAQTAADKLLSELESKTAGGQLEAAFGQCETYWAGGERWANVENTCNKVASDHLAALTREARALADAANVDGLEQTCRAMIRKSDAARETTGAHAQRSCAQILRGLGKKQAAQIDKQTAEAALLECTQNGWLDDKVAESILGIACRKKRGDYARRRFAGGDWKHGEGYELSLESGVVLVVPEGATDQPTEMTLTELSAEAKPPSGYRALGKPFSLDPAAQLIRPAMLRVHSPNAPGTRLVALSERFERVTYPPPDAIDGKDAIFIIDTYRLSRARFLAVVSER